MPKGRGIGLAPIRGVNSAVPSIGAHFSCLRFNYYIYLFSCVETHFSKNKQSRLRKIPKDMVFQFHNKKIPTSNESTS